MSKTGFKIQFIHQRSIHQRFIHQRFIHQRFMHQRQQIWNNEMSVHLLQRKNIEQLPISKEVQDSLCLCLCLHSAAYLPLCLYCYSWSLWLTPTTDKTTRCGKICLWLSFAMEQHSLILKPQATVLLSLKPLESSNVSEYFCIQGTVQYMYMQSIT